MHCFEPKAKWTTAVLHLSKIHSHYQRNRFGMVCEQICWNSSVYRPLDHFDIHRLSRRKQREKKNEKKSCIPSAVFPFNFYLYSALFRLISKSLIWRITFYNLSINNTTNNLFSMLPFFPRQIHRTKYWNRSNHDIRISYQCAEFNDTFVKGFRWIGNIFVSWSFVNWYHKKMEWNKMKRSGRCGDRDISEKWIYWTTRRYLRY